MSLLDLWLPILVAGVATHVCSFLAWVVLPHHKPEWTHLPISDSLRCALDAEGATEGKQYMLTEGEPDPSDPSNCRGMLILWNHAPNMGRNIALTLGFFLFISLVIGYLVTIALGAGASARDLFRFTATAALLAYSFGSLQHVIWFRRRCAMDMLDGLVYALVTGAAFALLTPA